MIRRDVDVTPGVGRPSTHVYGARIGTLARIRARWAGVIWSAVTAERVSRSRNRVRQGIHVFVTRPFQHVGLG
ncbi:hypothetical protein N5P18_14920 [Janibacter terrae]|uniref:Uncharacterized protein n=1 Tax=Janibacter terrae TaxID=103817 RepID=A0ABZ2FFK6_9MICO